MSFLARRPRLTYSPQMIDIIETVYRGASKGRGLVVSPKGVFPLPVTGRVILTSFPSQTIQLGTATDLWARSHGTTCVLLWLSCLY